MSTAPPPVVESVIESVIEDILIKDSESTQCVRRNVKVTKTHKKTNNFQSRQDHVCPHGHPSFCGVSDDSDEVNVGHYHQQVVLHV